MAEIFGFEFTLGRKKESSKKELKTFAPEVTDDGAVVVSEGGTFGTYLDLDGTSRTDVELITRYREMSLQPEIEMAVDEVVNDMICYDSDEKLVEINLEDLEYSDAIKDKIREEFEHIIELLDFNRSGYDILKRWYVDGRLYYHVIIDSKNTADGIQELRYIDPRKIRKVREVARKRGPNNTTLVDTTSEYFMYADGGFNSAKTTRSSIVNASTSGLKIAKDSIVHITSGLMDSMNQMVLSYLHKAIKPINQLRTLEDAAVIYRLSRAPERRIFYIDVGNLPKAKAEQHVRDMMTKHKNRLVYDAATGNIRDDRKFMTMLEDFWLPRREGGRGTEVTTLPGGQNLGEIEDVLYFQKKLYRSLGIPIGRLESDGQFNLGRASEITREELKFARFITRLRLRFSQLFSKSLEKQLILRGIIAKDEAAIIMNQIRFDFMTDGYFTELKEAEILRERLNIFKEAEDLIGKFYSVKYARLQLLKQSEEEIEQMDKEIEKERKEAEAKGLPYGGVEPSGADEGSEEEGDSEEQDTRDDIEDVSDDKEDDKMAEEKHRSEVILNESLARLAKTLIEE